MLTTQRLAVISEQFEELVNSDSLRWGPVDKTKLKGPTVVYLESVLEPLGVPFQMADIMIDDTALFKLEDEEVQYLHHDPQSCLHLFADAGFRHAFDGKQALIHLSRHSPEHDSIRAYLEASVLRN